MAGLDEPGRQRRRVSLPGRFFTEVVSLQLNAFRWGPSKPAITKARDVASSTSWLLIVAAASCGGGDGGHRVATTDSAGVRLATIGVAPTDVKEWRVGTTSLLTLSAEQTGDTGAFAFVGPVVWLSDGRIVVSDAASYRLLVFDSTGRYLRALGRRGDGPGEIRQTTSLTVMRGDSVATFDRQLRRLSVWHPDAGYVRSVVIDASGSFDSWPQDAWPWRDGLLVVMQLAGTPLADIPPSAGLRRWPTNAQLVLRDSAGRTFSRSPEFEYTYTALHERGDTRVVFAHLAFATPAPDRIYFGTGEAWEVAWLDSGFVYAGAIRWPLVREPVTEEEVRAVLKEARDLAAPYLPPERLATAFEKNFAPEMQPRDRPAIGRVIVADDASLWVQRFEASRLGPAYPPAQHFTVLSAAGEPLARVSLPRRSRLEAVRGNRLLLVMHDSLDVQTISVRQIVK